MSQQTVVSFMINITPKLFCMSWQRLSYLILPLLMDVFRGGTPNNKTGQGEDEDEDEEQLESYPTAR